ncbi:hypothetical protein, unlikely [Trypanosoma congolense IL3000]|uniref:Uncharacterized protein n=1 Tax=Trypanosoma congolense (strain IL3000) TaxID=1068625 RepID=F9WC41_TRYCI|nr:hypothetical protein, unlikely [Trypanosoma congolense IL3000]
MVYFNTSFPPAFMLLSLLLLFPYIFFPYRCDPLLFFFVCFFFFPCLFMFSLFFFHVFPFVSTCPSFVCLFSLDCLSSPDYPRCRRSTSVLGVRKHHLLHRPQRMNEKEESCSFVCFFVSSFLKKENIS